MSLINCEKELDLRWKKHCVISEILRAFTAVPNADPVVYELIPQITSATFQIDNAKLYVPVGTLSINNNIRFLENVKQEFKRKTSGNKNRSEVTTQPKHNNLDHLIDPTFRNINRLFDYHLIIIQKWWRWSYKIFFWETLYVISKDQIF